MMLNEEKKNLIVLWLTQTISQAKDSIYQLALLWLALEITQSNIVTGIISTYISVKVVFIFIAIGVPLYGVLSLSITQIREIQ